MRIKKIYLAVKQLLFLSIKTQYRILIAGRGFGKGVCISWSVIDKLTKMPGSKGLLTCNTLKQLKNKTLPNLQKVWKSQGMCEGKHYWLFKKPPPGVIARCLVPPTDWTDVISFVNGMHLECVSAKQYDNARGGSYDFIEGDEMCFFPESFFTEVVLPSLRGNKEHFGHLPEHHQVSLYSSMSKTLDGMWVINRFEPLSKSEPETFTYMEATTMDNIVIYGKKNLENQRKVMSYLTYMIEFFNMRVVRSDIPYYHNFDERRHIYEMKESGARVIDVNYNPDGALDVSADFGGWYSTAGVFQERNHKVYMLSQHDSNDIDEDIQDKSHHKAIAQKINKQYPRHRNKLIYLYGDPRGHDKSSFGKTPYDELKAQLELLGWTVVIKVTNYHAEDHQDRYLKMNTVLAEDEHSVFPSLRINKQTCSDVIVAVNMVERKEDFKKNKKKEKDKKFPQQHAPHNTDIVDYYYMQKYTYLFLDYSSHLPNSAGAA